MLPDRQQARKEWPPGYLLFGLRAVITLVVVGCLLASLPQASGGTAPQSTVVTYTLLRVQGTVEVMRSGNEAWTVAKPNEVLAPGDRLRTGERSRASVYLSSGMTIEKGELSEIEIPTDEKLRIRRGVFSILSREGIRKSVFQLRSAVAAIRGTDFLIRVPLEGSEEVIVLEGEVILENASGQVHLAHGDKGWVIAGEPPKRTALLESRNTVIQWVLYYPAILDLCSLQFTSEEANALALSLAAYQIGDIPGAVSSYPWQRVPLSAAESAYRAALLLSVGQVDAALALVWSNSVPRGFGGALERLVAAVTAQRVPDVPTASTATEWLAESYYRQSQSDLDGARKAAERAVTLSPSFGFGWSRLAEMHFSHAETKQALAALDRALEMCPRHAHAVALQGFSLAAQNRIKMAAARFNEAIELDSALALAWLGRGLTSIRNGDFESGEKDLLVAASLEPQRALYRTYLAQALSMRGKDPLARRELIIARALDPNDPTSWLYQALQDHAQNRVNDGVRSLERSKDLNDNRSLFRSQLLLDEDRAVRGANLASLYEDVGMLEVSVLEAARAVESDYANHSAHLFLANSYGALRDPNLINLRYETAATAEYLLYTLLAPPGSGALSRHVSEQEYAPLFEQDRMGLSSTTTYFSNGDWWQSGSQFGHFLNTAYSLDVNYQSRSDTVANRDQQVLAYSAQLKQKFSTQDTVFFGAYATEVESGDVRQYYSPHQTSQTLRLDETQKPNLLLGYHREWRPGMSTLFLAALFDDDYSYVEQDLAAITLLRSREGQVTNALQTGYFDLDFKSRVFAYSLELNQIWRSPKLDIVAGTRYQGGDVETDNLFLREPTRFPPIYSDPVADHGNETDLERLSVYVYPTWRLHERVSVTAGLTYDHLDRPLNVDSPPIADGQASQEQVSPKIGFSLDLRSLGALRAAYTRSLGGVFFDNSVRLEPVQIAGFNQAYRSLAPESLVGTVAGSRFETAHVGWDRRWGKGTYVLVEAELLRSDSNREVGLFDYLPRRPFYATTGTTRQSLQFEEQRLAVIVNQLLGDSWATGLQYRLASAELVEALPEIPEAANFSLYSEHRSTLHQVAAYCIFNSPVGIYARLDGVWTMQSNQGYEPDLPGDDFCQLDLSFGYRFAKRRARIGCKVMNLTDQDYRLNPLNYYRAFPRERTLMVEFAFVW